MMVHTVSLLRSLARRSGTTGFAAMALAAFAMLGVLDRAVAQDAPTKCDPTMQCCKDAPIGGDPKCAAASNPINVVTGNKYQREDDLPALPGPLGVEIVRHYNSAYSHPTDRNGLLGRGWRLSYEIELSEQGSNLSIVQADGSPLLFVKGILDPQHYVGANPADGRVAIRHTQRGIEYLWNQINGRQLSFDAQGHLAQIRMPSGEFTSLLRDAKGLLLQVTDPQGRSLKFNYLDAKSAHGSERFRGVQSIDTPVGRFVYEYGDAPAGSSPEQVTQRLANLVKVKLPTHHDPDTKAHPYTERGVSSSSVSRLYHYEDSRFPTLLTGISVLGAGSDGKVVNQRIGTYAYDAKGKGALTVKGEPARLQTGADGQPLKPYRLVQGTGIEQVVLDHSQPGRTIAINSLGQKTIFTHAEIAGQARLLEVRGAGCAHCAGPNVRFGYDKYGRLTETTQITAEGQPVQTLRSELDLYGRTKSVSRVDYRAGKAQAPQLLVRYGYAEPFRTVQNDGDAPAAEPTLIARPSVVAGHEHVVRIAYNDAGLPTSISEEGFSPLDEKDAPNPRPIKRSSAYAYGTVNGRILLTQIDGPLPNGPKADASDSDIIRIEWDGTGSRVVAVHAPGGLARRMTYDAAGRLATMSTSDGFTDRYTYDPLSRLVLHKQTLEHEERLVSGSAYRYDVLGRETEQLTLAGDTHGEELRPQIARGHDVAGRLIWQADRLGILYRATYDGEGHLTMSSAQGAGISQEERYIYDKLGRLERIEDNTGAVRRITHDDAGRIAGVIDPLGRLTRYDRGEPGMLEVTEAANTGKPMHLSLSRDAAGRLAQIDAQASDGTQATQRITTRLLKDDFLREVAVLGGDGGGVFKHYDAAGRLVQVQDATGTVMDIAYDAADRVVKRTVTPNATRGPRAGGIPNEVARPNTTLYVYEGNRLVEVRDPVQTERYAYDERGRVLSKKTTLVLAGGGQASSVTSYRYDEQGLLVAQSLPDGSELQYERNGQRQIVALHRQTAAWAPFGWGRTTLVKNLESDLVGLRSASYGNGVVGHWQRSREGMLGRVVYTSPAQSKGAVQTALESAFPDANAREFPAVPSPGVPPASAPLPGAFGMSREPRALWDSRLLYDAAGNILAQGQFARSAVAQPVRTAYAYDAHDQLAQAASSAGAYEMATPVVDKGRANDATVWRYHNDSLGNRLLAQQQQADADMGHTVKLAYSAQGNRLAGQSMDDGGFPQADAERRYEWDAEGRLSTVQLPGKMLARYRYDRRGLRVSKQTADVTEHYLYDERRQRLAELDVKGRVKREYVWMGDQLIAVVDMAQPRDLRAMPDGTLDRLGYALSAIWRAIRGESDAVAYVHVNHLGAPVAMTDENARPVWAADYAPFGRRLAWTQTGPLRTSAPGHVPRDGVQGIHLDLRLPGQWEDEETGLYYNDQRYYDPDNGRYLSPDPLGLKGGPNGYAYVRNNPLGYADPLGLVLFAFDGTGNSDPAPDGDTISNVRKFFLAYDTTANGPAYYITGIGTTNADMPYKGSMLSGDGFQQRLDLGFKFLNDFVDSDKGDGIVDLDIIGFSRGAAEARAWTNLVLNRMIDGAYTTTGGKTRCLNFRFEGVWDTVPHLGLLNGDDWKYDLSIPAQVKYAAHAVALDEHRGGAANFNARSIYDSAAAPHVANRNEIGLIGSHADVGGAYGTGDLSNVALMWMITQAKSQGIKLLDKTIADNAWDTVSNPILHDKSANKIDPVNAPARGDRKFFYGDRSSVNQAAAVVGGNTTAWAHGFVTYYDAWCGASSGAPAVGVVDMARYSEWLKTQGVDIKYTAPADPHPCN